MHGGVRVGVMAGGAKDGGHAGWGLLGHGMVAGIHPAIMHFDLDPTQSPRAPHAGGVLQDEHAAGPAVQLLPQLARRGACM